MNDRHRTRTWSAYSLWSSRSPGKPGSARRAQARVEHLESRRLLASITEIPVPAGQGAEPDQITLGPGGNLWFTEFGSGQIGMVNPTTHAVTEFPLPERNAEPFGITLGSDGNMWFTELNADEIGMINPSTHAISQIPVPTTFAAPYNITAGPDGTVWFTEWNANQIGMVNLKTDKISEFPIPTSDSVPEGITLGPDGNIWFTETLAGKIGMINTQNDQITEYPLPSLTSQPSQITSGPGGLWFTESAGNQILMINPATGAFSTPVSIPVASSEPAGITVGPEGYLWFTEGNKGQIGILNPETRQITELNTPTTNSGPRGMVLGADGNVWFTELNSGRVAVAKPDVNLRFTAAPPGQAEAGADFGLTVTATYDTGAVDPFYTGPVTVALKGTAAGSLQGTTSVAAKNGVAVFSGLSVTSGGNDTLVVNGADATSPLTTALTVEPVVVLPISPTPPPTPTPTPTPTPAPTPGPLKIIHELVLNAGKGKRKHLVGFKLIFSAPLNPSSAQNPTNYAVTQTTKRGHEKVAHTIPLKVQYSAAQDAVSLILTGKPKFKSGGQIVVSGTPPTGIVATSGLYLTGGSGAESEDAVLTIRPRGKGLASGD
jgi:streptogramin lyase